MGGNDHVTYHIWKYQKKGILMAYVSNHRKWFGMGFPKKEMLMDYVNRSCDLPKKEFLIDYISIFVRHFPKNYQKRKFDGLCK